MVAPTSLFNVSVYMTVKDRSVKNLEQLNEAQLQQKDSSSDLSKDHYWEQFADLYTEFAQEDRQLAEEGINEYAKLLQVEDRV